ncbi:uncharacterized protein LOC105665078 [Ceratitis capitata]|uniref:uncharacterized protein LOC105665078 n=1 Tax=Ceratitis capitata TaxID=7213 RepID=UPI0006188041|nr:uncharacterized protein LOC105665078 [Ceratitis capitata]
MELAEQIDDSTFRTMNECQSSPNITIASAGLINIIVWRPILTLASDYLPIQISIDRPLDFVSADHRTYLNFKKANCSDFTEFTENAFSALPTPSGVTTGERLFRRVVVTASARFIPAGRMAEIRPNFSTEVAVLASRRDTLRSSDPGNPLIRNFNTEIRRVVDNHKRKEWEEHLRTCNLSSVKSLSNPTRRDDRVEISFGRRFRWLSRRRKPPNPSTTTELALDLSKAFDTVNHSVLLTDIEESSLPPGLQRWVMGYLSGSKPRKI